MADKIKVGDVVRLRAEMLWDRRNAARMAEVDFVVYEVIEREDGSVWVRFKDAAGLIKSAPPFAADRVRVVRAV